LGYLKEFLRKKLKSAKKVTKLPALTVHALNFINRAMNENKYSVGVFFDLKKAFDVCSHDILLMKLSRMGISGTALNWFKSYLANRSQRVDINGNLSNSRCSTTGKPTRSFATERVSLDSV
jgi:hypothetical protein